MRKCITCDGPNSQIGDTCGCCNLRAALGYYTTPVKAKDEVDNMPTGAQEESKQMFFDKQTYEN